jgi:hypothetical protein
MSPKIKQTLWNSQGINAQTKPLESIGQMREKGWYSGCIFSFCLAPKTRDQRRLRHFQKNQNNIRLRTGCWIELLPSHFVR